MSIPTANTEAITPAFGDYSTNNGTGRGQLVTAVANDYTGVSANYVLVFTAGADGARIESVQCVAGGTNVASCARFFENNGSANTTATNNLYLGDQVLQATTASTVAPIVSPTWIPPGGPILLKPNCRLYVGLTVAVAAGWVFYVNRSGQY
jgi:hypothetical protein